MSHYRHPLVKLKTLLAGTSQEGLSYFRNGLPGLGYGPKLSPACRCLMYPQIRKLPRLIYWPNGDSSRSLPQSFQKLC